MVKYAVKGMNLSWQNFEWGSLSSPVWQQRSVPAVGQNFHAASYYINATISTSSDPTKEL